ncbi:MAG: hypothetical protein GY868_15205, partial [Deltaproteobacteria bacterium]|nr:hypothetical protein [Deltaproteobacteria bacterium]
MERKIVITGMGAVTPLGNSVEETWRGVVAGRSGVGEVTQFDASTFPVRIAGEVHGFEPDLSRIPEEYWSIVGRSTHLCLAATTMAFEDAGMAVSDRDPNRTGISLGADEEYLHFGMIHNLYAPEYTHSAFVHGQDAYCELLKHSDSPAKTWAFRKKSDIGSKIIALVNEIRGPLECSHTACSSSGHAIGKAKRLIENGDCDVVVAGG